MNYISRANGQFSHEYRIFLPTDIVRGAHHLISIIQREKGENLEVNDEIRVIMLRNFNPNTINPIIGSFSMVY